MTLPEYIDPTNATALLQYYQNHAVPQKFNAGVIVASIAVSFLGSYTTLILLAKRTATKGWRNIGYLVLAAITMSSVGIWGMHYIGMPSKLKPSPVLDWYIHLNPGFTILSLFGPVIALSVAFVFLGSQQQLGIFRVLVSGVLFGLIIAMMHFTASFSASFRVAYNPVQTVISIALACFAATGALFIFFRWRSQWQDNWWKRGVSSVALGCAVCAMHYLAVWGTSYFVRERDIDFVALTIGKQESTALTVAISVMCFCLCVICITIALADITTIRESRRMARHVVVASASFDKDGRLLIKRDGTLPTRVIETDLPLQELLRELDIREPTFQWLYSLSWCWNVLDPFLPSILAGVPETSHAKKEGNRYFQNFLSKPSPPNTISTNQPADKFNHLTTFRERFVQSTHGLAEDLRVPLPRIGVLFDKILLTGTMTKVEREGKSSYSSDAESATHQEIDPSSRHTEKEGVMLFLVREMEDNKEWEKGGYRMSETQFLAQVIADSVAVDSSEVKVLLDQLRVYAKRGTRPVVQAGGAYVGLFGVRPSISRQGGLDTLVYNFARHQIPAYRLPDVMSIEPSMRTWVGGLVNRTMGEVADACEMACGDDVSPQVDQALAMFQASLRISIEAMCAAMPPVWSNLHQCARLSAQVLEVPSSLDDSTPPAQMILFEAVLPSPRPGTVNADKGLELPGEHKATNIVHGGSSSFVFTPYSLFAKAQMMLLKGKGSADFARNITFQLSKRFNILRATEFPLSDAQSVLSKSSLEPEIPLSAWRGHERKQFNIMLSSDATQCPKQAEWSRGRRRRGTLSSLDSIGEVAHPEPSYSHDQLSISRAQLPVLTNRQSMDGQPPCTGATPDCSMGIRRSIQTQHDRIEGGIVGTALTDAAQGFITLQSFEPTHSVEPSDEYAEESRTRQNSNNIVPEAVRPVGSLACGHVAQVTRSPSLRSPKGSAATAATDSLRRASLSSRTSPTLRAHTASGATETSTFIVRQPGDSHIVPVLPSSTVARIKTDGWHSRCMLELERGSQRSELLGVTY